MVALGQQVIGGLTIPLAELSADGGETWNLVPFSPTSPDPALTALTADADGFTAAVQTGAQSTVWTSPGGRPGPRRPPLKPASSPPWLRLAARSPWPLPRVSSPSS
jgi:hypothetical protein